LSYFTQKIIHKSNINSLERSQKVLYYMNQLLIEDHIPHLLVFLDSPMAISITEVFKCHSELFNEEMSELLRVKRSPFGFPNLIMTQTAEGSKTINHIVGAVMIIAGFGMCTGSRVKPHLVTNISRRESTILFVGYQAVGTLGRQRRVFVFHGEYESAQQFGKFLRNKTGWNVSVPEYRTEVLLD